MRKLATLAVLLFVVLTMAAPAFAGGLVPGISFPLYEEQPTDVRAGVNQLVTFSSQPAGEVTWFYKNGFLLCVKDHFGIFEDLGYVRIDPAILGIDPKFLMAVETKVSNTTMKADGLTTDGCNVILNVSSLSPGLYVMATEVTQNASRVDRKGLLPALGQLIGIKKHNQVTSIDHVAAVFGVIDADDFIRTFASVMFNVAPNDEGKLCLSDEQKRLIRSAFIEQELRGVVQPARPLPAYSLLADAYARKVQGFPGAFAKGQSDMEKQLQALQQQLAESQAAAQRAEAAVNAAEAARQRQNADAEARAKAEADAKATEEAAKAWPQRLMEKYAGNTGFIFVAVGADGRPSGKKLSFRFFQMRSDCSWKENSASPMSLDDTGEGRWFYAGCVPSWKGFGLTTSDDLPGKMHTIHKSGIRVIAVPDNGGENYEVF